MREYTGIILSGGEPIRMGVEKGLFYFNQRPLIHYPIELLSKYCADILISCNSDAYNELNLPIVKDVVKNLGPIGGIYACLRQSKTAFNFVLPCDMPFVNEKLLSILLPFKFGYPIVVPSINKQPIPVCGLYSKTVISVIEKQIAAGNLKLEDLLEVCGAHIIEIDSPEMIASLTNLNTIDEIIEAEKKLRR